jgi:hypothetical protein
MVTLKPCLDNYSGIFETANTQNSSLKLFLARSLEKTQELFFLPSLVAAGRGLPDFTDCIWLYSDTNGQIARALR